MVNPNPSCKCLHSESCDKMNEFSKRFADDELGFQIDYEQCTTRLMLSFALEYKAGFEIIRSAFCDRGQ